MEEIRLSLPLLPGPKRKAPISRKQQSLPVLTRIPTRIRGPPLLVNKLSSAQLLRRDKTFASAKTAVGKALEDVYDGHVEVREWEIQNVVEQTNTFLYAIAHRINKNRHNLKFGEMQLAGPALNGLTTQHNYKHLLVYLPLKLKEFRLRGAYQGYTSIHTSRNPSYDRFQTIRSDSHKTLISPFKVSQAIHELMAHICQSVGRGAALPFLSNNSDYGEGAHQIVILLEDGIRLTIIPALYPRVLKKDEDGTIYVAKPYQFDKDPESDLLWRYDNPTRARRLLMLMDSADRGVRSKALRLSHICTELDPVLQSFPKEYLSMTLYNMFDEDVDDLPCWQTIDLERCFINMLTYWLTHMRSGTLLHPFSAGLNMLDNMTEHTKVQLKNRLTRLLSNRRELLRLLNSSTKPAKPSISAAF